MAVAVTEEAVVVDEVADEVVDVEGGWIAALGSVILFFRSFTDGRCCYLFVLLGLSLPFFRRCLIYYTPFSPCQCHASALEQ